MTKTNKTVLVDEEKLKKSQNDAKSEYWDNVRKMKVDMLRELYMIKTQVKLRRWLTQKQVA